MARVKGVLDPKNASESSSGGSSFQPGIFHVNRSVYRIVQNSAPEGKPTPAPFVALVLNSTRFDENLEPIVTDEGEEQREDIKFSLGGSSLKKCTPATADSPDIPAEGEDDTCVSAGTEVGAEGPTFDVHVNKWTPDSRSSIVHFYDSLQKRGFKDELLQRNWAPDFDGMIFELTNEKAVDEKTGKDILLDNGSGFNYKVVTRIIRYPYEAKKSATAKGSASAGLAKKSQTPVPATSANGSTAKASASGDVKSTLLKAVKLVVAEHEENDPILSPKTFRIEVAGKLKEMSIPDSKILDHTKMLKDPAFITEAQKVAGFTTTEDGDYSFAD